MTDDTATSENDSIEDDDDDVPSTAATAGTDDVAATPSQLVIPSPLDDTFYYYQHPTTGTVSSACMSLRQLCRLVCPVREGLKAILPPHTRCLQVIIPSNASNPPAQDSQSQSQSQSQQQQQQQQQFGEWKLASEIDILKQAACSQWYYSPQSTGDRQGPVSCRTLMGLPPSTTLVYAQELTPAWIALDQIIDTLQAVFEALQPLPPPPSASMVEPKEKEQQQPQKVQDELEAFLSSAADGMDHVQNNNNNDDDHQDENDDDEYYESDGGTKYMKDHRTGNWIHEALMPPKDPPKATSHHVSNTSSANSSSLPNPKKNKKAKFSKRNAKLWVYVTGLPFHGISVEDVSKYFSKAGLLDLDPETLQPKVKLYKADNDDDDNDDGDTFKGDASICYARPESVELALQILDESVWDEQHTLSVQRATFEEKKSSGDRKRKYVSEAKRKVAKLALRQAQDDGFGERLAGGRKGLRIVVVKHMVDQSIPESQVEETLHTRAEELGPVEKITWISKTRVAILKFKEPTAASDAVTAWNGKSSTPEGHSKMEAIYWDGVTDYTSARGETKKDEEHRHEEFGKWIETQELPPELQLQVEEH